jgi:S1-C subfamily serine protease
MDTDQLALQGISTGIRSLAEKAAAHVVAVSNGKRSYSGFLWKAGLVVTSDEALHDNADVTVHLADGTNARGEIAGRDASTDVALLRLEAPVAPEQALPSGPARFGSLAIVVGRDQYEPVAKLGLVSKTGARWQSMRGGEIDQRIELDVSLRRVQEGGIVIAADGALLGMAVFGPRRRTLVIPAQTIERVAAVLEKSGRISRGYLGLGLQPVEIGGGPAKGVMVLNVDPKGPGSSAGLLQGDMIVAWNDAEIPQLRALLRSLGPQSIGRNVSLRIQRAGEPRDLSLTIGERPAA